MNDKKFDYTINVFEFILGMSSDEWKELNSYLKENGDD